MGRWDETDDRRESPSRGVGSNGRSSIDGGGRPGDAWREGVGADEPGMGARKETASEEGGTLMGALSVV